MTRHKLIDGRWYLIRSKSWSTESWWALGEYRKDLDWFDIYPDNEIMSDDKDLEWIQIDPQFIWDESVE